MQVTLPGPKPGSKKGCAAVRAAADRGDPQGSASQGPGEADSDSDSLMDEEGDTGACAICYALHLPDPARPDEIGGCRLVCNQPLTPGGGEGVQQLAPSTTVVGQYKVIISHSLTASVPGLLMRWGDKAAAHRMMLWHCMH